MGQPVLNGAIYYHNGIPYTYQNGVAVFAGNEASAAAAAAAASPAPSVAAAAAAAAISPFMFTGNLD